MLVKIVVYVLLVYLLLQKLLQISFLTLVLTAFLLLTYTQSKFKASSMYQLITSSALQFF